MLESLNSEELANIRARYRKSGSSEEHDKLGSQAAHDVMRLLDHVETLEREVASLRAFKEEALAWGRALDEGWPAIN